jgi:CRP/FNR family cyclic AMP-dependent transcriptional regulator
MKTLESIVAQHPFFQELKQEWIQQIATCAYNAHFQAGEYVFREGEEAKHVYLLREGMVSLEMRHADRAPIVLQILGKDEILGWSWLFPPNYWRFDARVIEWTRAIALDGECLRAKCEADHDLGYELMKRFASIIVQRLQTTRMQYLERFGSEP